MSLDKAIAHGKEHRQPYYRGGKHDKTCRPGGSCPYCKGNRMHGDERRKQTAREQMQEAVHSALTVTEEKKDYKKYRDGEDLGVPVAQWRHGTHTKALKRKSDRVERMIEMARELGFISSGFKVDFFPPEVMKKIDTLQNELYRLGREIQHDGEKYSW